MRTISKECKEELPDYDRTSSVTSMTRDLGWSSLQSHCTAHDLTLFYKITNGAIIIPLHLPPPPPPNSFPPNAEPGPARNMIKHVDSFKYYCFLRTVPYWNSLLPTVVNANSLTALYSQVSNMYC